MKKAAGSASKGKIKSELYDLLFTCRRAFYYAFLFSFFMNILMLLLPIYSLQVLDRVISSHSYETLAVLTFITVVAFIAYGGFSLIRSFVLNGVVEFLDAKLAPRLLSIAVTRASIGHIANAGQAQRDLQQVKGFIHGGLPVLLDIPWSLMFILVIYMINPVLGFLSVAGVVVLLGFALINEFATKKPIDDAQENSIQSMQIADISAKNSEAIEAMGMMPQIISNWKHHADIGNNYQRIAFSRASIIQAMSRTLRMIIQIAVTGIGAYLALKNELTVGGMIASSILVGRALAPFEGAIGVWKTLVNARDSYHRIDGMLTTMPQLRGEMELPRPSGQLIAESAFFQPPNTPGIIKNVNFTLNAGESLGIIGPSAAGKSTLAKLIIGILPTTHGAIRLDGAETFKWNREHLGPHVGYMPQQVDLFNGTIKDNIARMQLDTSPEKVIEAAMLAGCHEMILRLPQGYETEFMQGNLSLSPGQRQRIGLARALYGRPQFVVLDEPNINLDGEGERALVGALARIKQLGITYIVVAHRPSIVGNVDKILMLRNGVVESFGPRDEVLRQYVQPTTPQQPQQPQQGAAE